MHKEWNFIVEELAKKGLSRKKPLALNKIRSIWVIDFYASLNCYVALLNISLCFCPSKISSFLYINPLQ